MKKLLIALVFALGFSGIAAAQQAPKKVVPTATKLQKAKPAATAAKTGEAPKKADGTPDMRYKANKMKTPPPGKLKKDGTPDMRYSENKKKKG